MYESSLRYERTPDEKRDVFLSWARPDKAFFAAGACHILAHQFLSIHPDEGYKLVRIKPIGEYSGNHYYTSNGTWAFDFNGWTRETELLSELERAYSTHYPGWSYTKTIIEDGLMSHLASGDHNLRPPEYFPYLPWERAYKYIERFPEQPPA